MPFSHDLVLASRSPRRARLLAASGISFRLGPAPDVDEALVEGVPVPEAARLIAVRKARAVVSRIPDGLVLCADTIVFLGNAVFGKPRDAVEAASMLFRLGGRTHEVATGVALALGDRVESGVDVARVTFRELERAEIEAYVATGEPLDKAGGYAIQGGAAAFLANLEGTSDTVVGLPIRLLRDLGARFEGGALGLEGAGGR